MSFYDVFFTYCILGVSFYDVFSTFSSKSSHFTTCFAQKYHFYEAFWRSLFKKHVFFQPRDAAEAAARARASTGVLIIWKSEPYYAKAYLGNKGKAHIFPDVLVMVSMYMQK